MDGNTRVNRRQTVLLSLVTDSLWTVKFDAGGKVSKDEVDHRDSKRVRFTHKQPDKRADMELTDDTRAKSAKLFDTSSSRSSRLRRICSSGEIGDPETR